MGTAHVETVGADAFDAVYPLLQNFQTNNPQITRERWQRLFDYTWPVDQSARALVLRDGENYVGIVCTLFSDRFIRGRRERRCNVNSWYVEPAYRAQSLELMAAALSVPCDTMTALTPMRAHLPFYEQMGLQRLEDGLRILLPQPTAPLISGFRATRDPQRIADLLDEKERTVFLQHREQMCQHLLIYGKSARCYVAFTRTPGRRVWFSHLHHIGHLDLFLAALNLVKFELYRANRTFFTMIEERFLRGHSIPGSRPASLKAPRLFRSTHLRPGQIDNLHSEMVVLGV
jgi:hypothetical protein